MIETSEQDVIEVIQNSLSLEGKTLTLESGIGDTEEWDSLGHLGILSALDKHFDGQVAPLKEMATADTVSKILKVLKENSLL